VEDIGLDERKNEDEKYREFGLEKHKRAMNSD